MFDWPSSSLLSIKMHRDFKKLDKNIQKTFNKKKQFFQRKQKNDDALFPWLFDPVR